MMEGPLVADLRRAFTYAGVICPSISRVLLSEDSFAVLAVGSASSLPVLQGLKLPSRLLQTRQLPLWISSWRSFRELRCWLR